MPELLALSSALVFGLVHFFSGLLSRRGDSSSIAFYGQVGGTLAVAAAAVFIPASDISTSALLWGALSGVGTGLGVAFLYRGMSTGRISVVVPLSDVGAVALPVIIGVALIGDRPSTLAWVGVAAAFPALWMVSRTGKTTETTTETGTIDALIAGTGFALQFIAIAQISLEAGLWPILAARIMAAITIVPFAYHHGAKLRLSRKLLFPAGILGAGGSIAIILYLLATQEQMLALATVLAALYPAIPVILALMFLHERLKPQQSVGLILTGAAITLITLG